MSSISYTFDWCSAHLFAIRPYESKPPHHRKNIIIINNNNIREKVFNSSLLTVELHVLSSVSKFICQCCFCCLSHSIPVCVCVNSFGMSLRRNYWLISCWLFQMDCKCLRTKCLIIFGSSADSPCVLCPCATFVCRTKNSIISKQIANENYFLHIFLAILLTTYANTGKRKHFRWLRVCTVPCRLPHLNCLYNYCMRNVDGKGLYAYNI